MLCYFTLCSGFVGQVWELLQEDPKYFASFKRSQLYIKLLMELDLIQDGHSKQDETHSFDDGKFYPKFLDRFLDDCLTGSFLVIEQVAVSRPGLSRPRSF